MKLTPERHALAVLNDHIDCLIDQKKFADEEEDADEIQKDIDDLKRLVLDCGGQLSQIRLRR